MTTPKRASDVSVRILYYLALDTIYLISAYQNELLTDGFHFGSPHKGFLTFLSPYIGETLLI